MFCDVILCLATCFFIIDGIILFVRCLNEAICFAFLSVTVMSSIRDLIVGGFLVTSCSFISIVLVGEFHLLFLEAISLGDCFIMLESPCFKI